MLWKEQDQDHDYWLFGKLQGQFIRVMNLSLAVKLDSWCDSIVCGYDSRVKSGFLCCINVVD